VAEEFKLTSREEVVRFEELADSYAKARTGLVLNHLSLARAHDYCRSKSNGGKLFAASLDVFINFLLLHCDMHSVGATWNSNFSKGGLEGGSVLDSEAKFWGKMDIQRFNSSYVFRYRALGDKIMGLLVLMHAPDRYEAFLRARSRRASFEACTRDVSTISPGFVAIIQQLLKGFDDEFRTAETHGTGRLRKWSFSMDSMDKNPAIRLIGYWNMMINVMVKVGESFILEDADGDARPG
jgi:hypothetical protein